MTSPSTNAVAAQRPERAARVEPPRRRYRRGEGAKLRDDIVGAARQLLERGGTVEAVTLRAVAREIGIAAQSIYRHFPDRDAIVEAVELATFDELQSRISAGSEGQDIAAERLVGGCKGYVEFALEYPGRYQILFNQLRGAHGPEPAVSRRTELSGFSVFQLLVAQLEACVQTGQSASTDPVSDSTNIWAALHGISTLRSSAPDFPWQPIDITVRDVVRALGHLTERSAID